MRTVATFKDPNNMHVGQLAAGSWQAQVALLTNYYY